MRLAIDGQVLKLHWRDPAQESLSVRCVLAGSRARELHKASSGHSDHYPSVL